MIRFSVDKSLDLLELRVHVIASQAKVTEICQEEIRPLNTLEGNIIFSGKCLIYACSETVVNQNSEGILIHNPDRVAIRSHS